MSVKKSFLFCFCFDCHIAYTYLLEIFLVESLMEEVEACLNMVPKYETLVARAKLAAVSHFL